ncbi:electron transport complex subunit RsxD [Pantoea sp. Nvir]|uniref:electron transport complex subunit RsxD n=1 Tax=Pantoea sp. Nvir TaxID=2576760 RepID=UPI0027F3DCC5|nr:electron transport complex subunit RsxD [Pantoea sp. Nvir]CAJ0991744.1 Ion-translocating oxidoreductase complex subunit D [Pantoea sp. Nvir]
MSLHIASSSYIHNRRSTGKIMLLVVLATMPGFFIQCYFFGYGSFVQVLLAVLTACLAEAAILKLRKISVMSQITDNSALLTAVLIGVSLPPITPWWIVVIGTIFAIVIAKQLYGGLGQNLFNPAMVGYVVLLISFPLKMTSWPTPNELQVMKASLLDSLSMIFTGHTLLGDTIQQLQLGVDGISQATPLDNFKTELHAGHSADQILAQPIYTDVLSSQWVNIGYLAGGLFLLWKNVIRWHIPAAILLALILCSTFGWIISPKNLYTPFIHLFSGATMLGAFFIATDPVTASTTNGGRLIYGALIGILLWLIRSFGRYPDGVAFAVLLANICVPLIDYYTQPRVYGHRQK